MPTIEQIFDKLYEIEYLTVGGLASMLYGVPRNTFDIDIMIFYTDIIPLIHILQELGYKNCIVKDTILPINEVTAREMIDNKVVMFIDGVKIDVIILDEPYRGLWSEIYNRGVLFEQEDTSISTINIIDLIEMKRNTRRSKDLKDVKTLTNIMKKMVGK